jgi:hypothetical protein
MDALVAVREEELPFQLEQSVEQKIGGHGRTTKIAARRSPLAARSSVSPKPDLQCHARSGSCTPEREEPRWGVVIEPCRVWKATG